MLQSKVVKYIQELSAKDRERFRQFVCSPYFNQHQKTLSLLEIILETLEENEPELDRKVVFKILFPKQGYDEQKLHNILSYLKKLFHRFLAYEHFETQPFQEQLLTLESAYESNQFELLKNRSKQLSKVLSNHPYHNSDYFYSNYRLNYLMGYYSTQYVDRTKSDMLQKMLDNFDMYYISEKLKNCCHLTANMMLVNSKFNFNFLEELMHYLRQHWPLYEKEASISLYFTILMMLREESNPDHYRKLKDMLATQIQLLSPQEGRDLYGFAYNYCIMRINHGDSAYQRELFQLYKQGLKQGLLFNHGHLLEWDYKNITTLGCRLKEFEWTENFIEDYKDKLPENQRENAYNFNLANLYYNKKMYNEALSVLLLVQFTDIKYHLNTTFLLLRTYYAMQDTEALLSLIETFRIYIIRNQKMTTDQKRGYTNFLRFAKKLVLLKHHSSTFSKKALAEKLNDLVNKIENTDNVINRYWLLEESRA